MYIGKPIFRPLNIFGLFVDLYRIKLTNSKTMKKEGKKGIAEALSLMKRMETKGLTGFEGKIIKEQMINEAVKKNRVQVTRDQIFDILDAQPAGQYVCITYINAASPYKTKRSWRSNDVQSVLDKYQDKIEGNEHWYTPLSKYQTNTDSKEKNPISSIITVTRYNFQWTTKENFKKGYGNYESRKSNLNMKYGLSDTGKLGDYHGDTQENDYGGWENSKGEQKLRQNLAHVKKYTTCYIVNDEGGIVGGIPNDVVKSISSVKNYDTTPAAAKNNLTPELLKAYQAELDEIDKDFAAREFKYDKVLCVVATANNTPYYYINDKAIVSANKKTNVNQEDLIKIGEELIGKTFQDLDNFALENHTPTK